MSQGRPSSYTQEMANTICEQIAEGQSLRSICQAEDMPAKSTVFKWLTQNKDFADQYARARETQADAIFDEILSIADEKSVELIYGEGEEQEVVEVRLDSTAIQRNRLRVDARKWMAGKLRPKVYGEKQAVEHSGPDGGPIELTHSVSAETRGLLEGLSSIGANRGAETPVSN